nr:MAG TPA_asm: Ribosomal L38e protein family [Caudoviricetes sp.]
MRTSRFLYTYLRAVLLKQNRSCPIKGIDNIFL